VLSPPLLLPLLLLAVPGMPIANAVLVAAATSS
jgi:hypothetical protein